MTRSGERVRSGLVQAGHHRRGADARWQRSQRGSATVLTAGLALVMVVTATAAVMTGAVLLASHRARSAADLAALAAATAQVSGLDPCSAARANARQNGANLAGCQVSGRTSSFVVTVTAVVDTGLAGPMPSEVKATARAGNIRDE